MAVRFLTKPAQSIARTDTSVQPRIVRGTIGPIFAKDLRLGPMDPTPVDQVQAFQEAIKTPPWDQQPEYDLGQALQDLYDRRWPNKRLKITRINPPESWYWVRSYDPDTRRATLEDSEKRLLKPVISEREHKLYRPEWLAA